MLADNFFRVEEKRIWKNTVNQKRNGYVGNYKAEMERESKQGPNPKISVCARA